MFCACGRCWPIFLGFEVEREAVSELQPFTVGPVPPSDRDAQRLLWVYFGELVTRYQGRPGTDEEIRGSMIDDPSDDLVAPTGVLLLGRLGSNPVGCIGLRMRPQRVGQVTRMFVTVSARCQGFGFRLMDQLEALARNQGITRLEVDTRDDLVEAPPTL